MHQLLSFKCKFPNHFAFTLGHYLFLLFLVKFRDERSGWLVEHWELRKSRFLVWEGFGYQLWMQKLVMEHLLFERWCEE
jgi:hypothetical protein